jgi:N utilization substance protein A
LVEAFIEEGFLSYDDLTFLEPAQLAELAGITEEQADEMIVFAEEAAEQVEEQAKIAREEAENAPPPETEGAAANNGTRASGTPTAADLFAGESSTPTEETKPVPTLESLFGEDVKVKTQEPKLDASQVFSELPPSAPEAVVPPPESDE